MSKSIDKNEGMSKKGTNKGVNSGKTVEHQGTKNLTPFPPGVSGNPKGRPKGAKTGLRARMMQMLDQQTEADILKVFEAKGVKLEHTDKAGVISHVIGREAIKGNMQAIKILTDQTELPHPKDLKLTGDFHIVMPEEDADTL